MSTPRVGPARAAGRLGANVARGLRDLALSPFESRVPRTWVAVRLDHGLVEVPLPPTLAAFRREPVRTLSGTLECLERARRDPQVRGVILRVGTAPLGWAKLSSLVRALEGLRAGGVRTVVYADATGNAGAWLGAVADHFWVAPAGHVDLIGVRVESPFLRALLDRLGIRADVLSGGRFKSAAEILTREGWSDAAREALEAVVDEYAAALVGGIAAGRGVDPERAKSWIDAGPYRARQALEAGLIDDLVYPDELPARLAALVPQEGSDDVTPVSDVVYTRLSRPRFHWRPVAAPPARIAIVPLIGVVRAGLATGRGVVGTLRRLADDPEVGAVVLRVDSPGGDALASDLIWRAVRELAKVKPVVASLADTAASGGYYAAMAAQEVVAEPTTLTGSIGVVLASLDLSEGLARLGVSFDAIQRGEHAGIFAATRRRSDPERARLREHVRILYDDFVTKAAEDRGVSVDQLRGVAEGRIWTGSQALERGLIDHAGGLGHALERARALAGLAEGEGDTVWITSYTSPFARWLRSDPLEAVAPASDGALCWCPIRIPLH